MSITKQTLIEAFEVIDKDPELRIMLFRLISHLKCREGEDPDEFRKLEDKIIERGDSRVTSLEDVMENHRRICNNFDPEW